MNLSVAYHVVGAAVCVAISYGINQHQKPSYEPNYPAESYVEQHGSLQLTYHGETLTYPLTTTRVSSHDITRLGRTFKLRELSMRATGPRDQPAKLEIYVDVSRVSGGAGDPRSLAQVELPVSRSGRYGARPSFVVVAGAERRQVISGNLLLTEVVPLPSEGAPRYRTAGRLELQLDGPGGVELITGRLDGRIASDTVP